MKQFGILSVFLSLIVLPIQSLSSTNTTTCPIDFSYVLTVPFNSSSCKNFEFPTKTPELDVIKNSCCRTLLSVLGIGLAQHLKDTSLFLLPNIATSTSCLQDYRSKLTSISLPTYVVDSCFEPSQFITSPKICASIESSQDWVDKLNHSTALDSACKPDLMDHSSCDACVAAGFKIQQQLITVDGNTSHSRDCWIFTVLYAAGMINELGPESSGSLSCIFGLLLDSHVNSNRRSITTLVIILTSATAGFLIILCSSFLWKKKTLRNRREHSKRTIRKFNAGDGENDTELPLFSLRSILEATDNFAEANKLGEGGFGPVYKGIFPKNQEVAMKRLSKKSGQRHPEFVNELKLIAKLQHTNLVRLLGCCIDEEEMILVYEYMPNRSLDKFLFEPSENTKLDWGKRFRIIEGIAHGILYIHKYSRLKIIHRDLKASNVLLDEEMYPKISDFGMAKIFEKNQTEANTNRVVGTYGYMSPEYASYGNFSEKSDVFSFGVLLLEIISGKRNAAFYRFEDPLTLAGWVSENSRLGNYGKKEEE
ncbi:probable receptor-like protein kinase At1g11050 isoform X2 [Rosa rugosa]|uniref:probable receptor-like protein kinase At1g11050 isoform X2 n=1 Tax=Rosa rugosa TaxID=74645 RepID=UPI002B404195|nr:probable receptor-like protein kinase At1g11050 isoform X2 [Rosa rugosa]